MVIEILSPSTVRNDCLTKFNLYQRASVREYRPVNPVERNIQVFALENGCHIAAAASGRVTLKVPKLKGCSFEPANY